ncbi:uncharacterized protein VTP21DRAFT_9400 [Calcarisporiella thermophila]|uniref:uncharacterized protein n=1 Tax=Calcarisporiella thermophila TaxID=911321 RepID=UPI003743D032
MSHPNSEGAPKFKNNVVSILSIARTNPAHDQYVVSSNTVPSRAADTPMFAYALHDFAPEQDPSADYLTFQSGERIQVLHRDESGWWYGECLGRRGWFPSNYTVQEESLCSNDENQRVATLKPNGLESDSGMTADKEAENALYKSCQSCSGTSMLDLHVSNISSTLSSLDTAVRLGVATRIPSLLRQIIWEVRALLVAAGVTKSTSVVIEKFPRLGAERRMVLETLSALSVNCRSEEHLPDKAEHIRMCGQQLLGAARSFVAFARTIPQGWLESNDASLTSPWSSSPRTLSQTSSSTSLPSTGTSNQVKVTPEVLTSHYDSIVSRIARLVGFMQNESPPPTKPTAVMLLKITQDAVCFVKELLSVVERMLELLTMRDTCVMPLSSSDAEKITSPQIPTSIAGRKYRIIALCNAKRRLYMTTSNLVTAARVFSTGVIRDKRVQDENSPKPEEWSSEDEDDRTHLTECCSAVVRATCDLIAIANESLDSYHQLLFTISEVPYQTNNNPGVSMKRSKFTLSFLERKALCLNCLREQFASEIGLDADATDEKREEIREWRNRDKNTIADLKCGAPTGLCQGMDESRTSAVTTPTAEAMANPYATITSAISNSTYPFIHPENLDVISTLRQYSCAEADSSLIQPPTKGPRLSSLGIEIPPRNQSLELLQSHQERPSSSPFRKRAPISWLNPLSSSRSSSVGSSRVVSFISSQKSPTMTRKQHPTGTLKHRASSPSISKDQKDKIWFLKPVSNPEEIQFSADGHVYAATLEALVERLTTHDATPDALYFNAFFLTFRLFCTPLELCEQLMNRFRLSPPNRLNDEEMRVWRQSVQIPLQLRVYNVIKAWLETYWETQDQVVLKYLEEWATALDQMGVPALAANRMLELIHNKRLRKSTRLVRPRYAQSHDYKVVGEGAEKEADDAEAKMVDVDVPVPQISKQLLYTLRNAFDPSSCQINVTNFDPLEMARQLTLFESRLYRRIQPSELIARHAKKDIGEDNIRQMGHLSTRMTSWIISTVLRMGADARRRASIIRFWIKVGEYCMKLSNFSTLMSIVCALNSTTITRLRRTWESLSTKSKVSFESLCKAMDHSRNFATYRARLNLLAAPSLPFLGVYLTDLIFVNDGNPSFRVSPSGNKRLINFDKYMKVARIVLDVQRFQIPYALQEIEEVQTYLKTILLDSSGKCRLEDASELYEWSLSVEPREEERNGEDIGAIAGASRSLSDLLRLSRSENSRHRKPIPTL